MKLFEIKLTYTMPNFRFEWDEATRYPELEELGEENWIKLAQQGRRVRLSSLKDVSNMDPELQGLDQDKVSRAQDAFKSRTIELPIVVRINGENDLLGGNTRIAYLLDQEVDPAVWIIDVDKILYN